MRDAGQRAAQTGLPDTTARIVTWVVRVRFGRKPFRTVIPGPSAPTLRHGAASKYH